MRILKIAIIVILIGLFQLPSKAQTKEATVKSPNGKLSITLHVSEEVSYSVKYKGETIIEKSPIKLILDNVTLGEKSTFLGFKRNKHKGVITLPYGNQNSLTEEYSELTANFKENFSVVLRAYDEGVAYRFETKFSEDVIIKDEVASFLAVGNPAVEFGETDSWTSWELPYVHYNTSADIPVNKKAQTPILLSYPNTRVIIAESDVLDYPGMYIQKSAKGMEGVWAKYPKRTELGSWGNFVSVVKEKEDFIAKTKGTRTFPWRIVIATDDDKSLLNNTLVFKLAKPLAIDASWIKPGKATWEWWHDAIVEDAGIPSGMDNRNTALYKHYIDFAAANGLEFLMLDAGWSNIFDLSKIQKKNDIHELIRYGKSKGVDLFLWCVATAIIDDLDKNMKLLSDWGVVGIKIDFIDRDDQEAITWFEKMAASAAKHKLMINFHGCSKPTGLERAYPNIVNYEAVRGAECSKWDWTASPDQRAINSFVRSVAGPLDYTPGSMRNRTRETFKPVDPGLPSTQGTRVHEMALYVMFYQPFAMLCDAPAEYRKYPDIMRFFSVVPTTFDQTVPLKGKVGEVAIMAKRKGDDWFVGAISNWTERDEMIDFSFLPKGKKYKAHVYEDGANANVNAEDYVYKTITVDRTTKMPFKLAQGGGLAVYLEYIN